MVLINCREQPCLVMFGESEHFMMCAAVMIVLWWSLKREGSSSKTQRWFAPQFIYSYQCHVTWSEMYLSLGDFRFGWLVCRLICCQSAFVCLCMLAAAATAVTAPLSWWHDLVVVVVMIIAVSMIADIISPTSVQSLGNGWHFNQHQQQLETILSGFIN